MAKKKKKYYVVWRGRKRGIYTTWAQCQVQIHGYPGAQYKSFPTQSAAEEALAGNYEDVVSSKAPSPKTLPLVGLGDSRPVVPSIAVDAACSGNPGIMEYRGVDTQSGEVLFHKGPFLDATNNLGEFLALVDGLRWLQEQKSEWPLYTDSRTALAWLRHKKIKTTLPRVDSTKDLFLLLDQALEWLQHNTYQTTILKWDTEEWGEIPADFGRKS